VCATIMRRILVNHEMARRTQKRETVGDPLTLSGLEVSDPSTNPDVVAVHDALLAFEALDPRAAKVVEMRYFGGLELEEIAEAMDLSLATVKRDWSLAKAWLKRELFK
jgi:RNA polymerase sigma factor (TIGR02999 family)